MGDNKVLAIMFICVFAFLSIMIVFGDENMNETQQVKIEKEKTKQLELHTKLKQLQIDSMQAAAKLK